MTAIRWMRILRSLGHTVNISHTYTGEPADAMLALHAWRSANAIALFAEKYPQRPLIVALTGTDAYRFIHSHPDETLTSLATADCLVGLHARIGEAIPKIYQAKVRIIYQSLANKPVRKKHSSRFSVCVAGHLRYEKDPLRPAYAVRHVPKTSQIYISHFGKAHNLGWAQQARLEMARNRRYCWRGEINQAQLHRVLARSQLLALPSRIEGGANIVSEAIVLGAPVIASDVEGSRGLLGEDYPGYYPVEDTGRLRELLLLCEKDTKFYQALKRACRLRRRLFTPGRERASWQKLLAEFS